MRVALDRHRPERFISILLMRHADLVSARHRVRRRLLPRRQPDEMLRLEQRVAEEAGCGRHGDELFRGHFFPERVQERAVVDLPSAQVRHLAPTPPPFFFLLSAQYGGEKW